MKWFRLILALAFAAFSFNGYAQCSCGCAAGGSLFGDYSGTAVNERNRITAEASYDFKTFRPHIHTASHVHNHGSHSSVEGAGIEMKAMSTASFGLRYGLSRRATALVSVPYAVLHAGSSSEHGVGDISIAGVYRIVGLDKFALSGIGGVEVPTGRSLNESLADDVVIGSGSYDPFGGLVAIVAHKKLLFRVNGLYKHNFSGSNDIQYGSNLSTSLSVGYSNATSTSLCLPPTEKKTTWSVNAIGLVEQNGRTYADNVLNENSGGTTAFGGVGLSLTVGRVMIPVSALVPFNQHLHGEQHRVAFKARIGAAITF